MTFPDSMFLFETIVEELNSYIRCKEFYIRIQFTNIFSLNLKDPNEVQLAFSKTSKKKKHKRRIKVKNIRSNVNTSQNNPKVKRGQSILFTSNINSLISIMKTYPMELYLWSKGNPEDRIGSTTISWNPLHIDYLNKINRKYEPSPQAISGEYDIFKEVTSKRMATIKLNIKLTCLRDRITTQVRSLSDNKQDTFMYPGFYSEPAMILTTIKHNLKNAVENIELKKATYKTDICKYNQFASKRMLKNINSSEQISNKNDTVTDEELRISYGRPKITCMEELCDSNKSSRNVIKSVTKTDKNNQITVSKYKSCSSISPQAFKMSDYIFGDDRYFGNKVYCVGYFTVENNKSKESSKSSLKGQNSDKSTTDSKVKYDVQTYDNEYPNRKADDNSCSKSVCSMDLAEQAANLINVTKCKQVDCDNRDHSKALPQPVDRILLDISNIGRECCDISEKVEEVVGEMKAKMKFEGEPCYCSCECTFGFTKKTTYCSVCGGYEKTGEDLARRQRVDMPVPCPVFHKLIDKNKLKTWSTSGSSVFSKKKADDSQRSLNAKSKSATSDKRSTAMDKGAESEKDAKKGKKKDDRFKFNYGYQAPQIGHSRCAFSCTGTLGTVPKHMGWLWTAENVPGLKVPRGWKPGAISKRLLRILKKAKQNQRPVEEIKLVRKQKKLVEDKATLSVSKKDGEVRIAMQVASELGNIEPSPLVYRITREDNVDRIKKRERQTRRFIREAVREVCTDPYHPDVCEDTCLKAYRQAIEITQYVNDSEYTSPEKKAVDAFDSYCSDDEEISTECSSLDNDWEMRFSPPIAKVS